jgi:hypothetical protein
MIADPHFPTVIPTGQANNPGWEGSTMAKVSRDSVPEVADFGVGEDRTDHFDDWTVCFTTIRQDADLAPLLKGLPDDKCQCPHWGYVFRGRLTVRYNDHEETIEAGEAYYMPPGHAPAATAGSEFVMFSPTDDLAVSEAQINANMQTMMQAG